jgi:hypothetical protein
MSLLGSETLTVTPQTAALVDGTYQLTPGASFSVVGTVLPIPGKALQRLSEGARQTATHRLIVEGQDPGIRITDTASPSNPADRVTRADGRVYVASTDMDLGIHATGLPNHGYILHKVQGDE